MSSIFSRLPSGGLFFMLVVIGSVLYTINTDAHARSLCVGLVLVNIINLTIFPFRLSLNELRESLQLPQWKGVWLKYQVIWWLMLSLLGLYL
jgi:hypothetical protein